jgi:ribosome-associated protein
MLRLTPEIQIPLKEIQFSYTRSSGPGGQNVNKVSSKAVLRWDLLHSPSIKLEVKQRFQEQFPTRLTTEGFVVLTSDRFRDRLRNQEDCLEKLGQLLLAVAYPPKKRKKTRPTRASVLRRRDSKKRQSEKKQSRGWRD